MSFNAAEQIHTSRLGRRAFTLLEMLLATALLSVLMLGVLAVVADFSSTRKMLNARHPQHAVGQIAVDRQSLEAWSRLLEDDLLHARTVDTRHENQAAFSGYSELTISADARSLRPVHVTYQIQDLGDRKCLVRAQTLLDLPTNQARRHDLVCIGIERFTLTPVNAVPSADGKSPATEPSQHANSWRLRAWVTGQAEPVIDQQLATGAGGTL